MLFACASALIHMAGVGEGKVGKCWLKKNTKRFSYSVLMTSLIFVARKQRVKQKIIVIVKELGKKFVIL